MWFNSKKNVPITHEQMQLFNRLIDQQNAINQSIATIEFTIDGEIIDANDNFLKIVGYQLDEVRGKHHRLFIPAEEANSAEYRAFWHKLKNGQFNTGEYRRLRKDNNTIWLQASYIPIINQDGKISRVIKFAMDITKEKEQSNYNKSKIAAINKSMAVIEFSPDGTIMDANPNILNVMGYTISEIIGKKAQNIYHAR